MQNKTSLLVGVIGLAALLASPAFADNPIGKKHEGTVKAKITPEEARVVALNAFPGSIAGEELEKERGGSGLRYSFDIKQGKVTQEVGVDAETGKVLENQQEGSHPD